VIGSAVFSWLYAFNIVNARNPLVGSIGNFFYKATEPVLRPIRNFLPDLGGLDISPIVVLIIVYFLRTLLWTSIVPMLAG
jgi:YggT family protein